jgi:Sulfotransferase family
MQKIIDHYKDSGYVQYNFHISREPSFIYVNNPKCGCTTTKATLNLWYAAWHNLPLAYSSMGDIHRREHNPLLSPAQIQEDWDELLIDNPAYFRVTLLRNPISRIVSAYASKFSWASEERQGFNRALGQPEGTAVTFGTFLEAISQQPGLRDSNEHWRPQAHQIAAGLIDYDQICFLETLDEDLLRLREKLFPGLRLDVFETRERFPDNRSSSAELLASLSEADLAQIKTIYAEDVALFEEAQARKRGSA